MKIKKVWKYLLGGLAGAVLCGAVVGGVVSCSNGNTTSNSTPTTQSSSTKKVSEPNTPAPTPTSSPKTNPYYMLGNNSNTSTFVSEPTTPSLLNFYLGGSTTPNTNVQLSADNTYNINLQLNPMGQSDEGSVLSSYKTSPTLLAIVPTNTLTTNFGGKTAYTFNKSSPLLLQAVSGDPFQTNNMTDNTTLNNVCLPMYVTNKESGKALTSIQLPIPYERGTLDFGLTSETFKVDINNTAYTINLEVNFTPYLVQATTPLTASDFNLNTTMPGALSTDNGYFNYHPGETYREFYIHNNTYHQNNPTWWLRGIPAPMPTLLDGYDVGLNGNGGIGGGTGGLLYINEFTTIVEYNMTSTQWTNLIEALINEAINSK